MNGLFDSRFILLNDFVLDTKTDRLLTISQVVKLLNDAYSIVRECDK